MVRSRWRSSRQMAVDAHFKICRCHLSSCRRSSRLRYVDKILRGAHPREMPIYQGSILEVLLILKAAKALGLTIPSARPRRRGDRVDQLLFAHFVAIAHDRSWHTTESWSRAPALVRTGGLTGSEGARPARRLLRPPNLQRGHRSSMIRSSDREARYGRGIRFSSRLKRVVVR
jgi:hypothetical protein